MNGHATTTNEYANGSLHSSTRKYDVVIVGAGISGINAAYQVQTSLPDSTYTVLEGRHELGGTWSLFKYPGIRSDSDLHTFGFPFNPWSKPNPIASGESILEYLHETVNKFGIDRNIAYGHRVASADWVSAEQLWRLEVDDMQEQDDAPRRKIFWARFIVMGTGYYNYETPLKVHIPGIENFKGETIHPQFWPENFDYKGKRIVVIGSGATTITLLPALVEGGVAHVTQLQRSPSFILSVPNPKPGDRPPLLERILPQWIVFRMKRFMNTLLPYVFYRLSQRFPNLIAGFLRREAKRQLPSNISIDPHFKPTYGPFQQRLCLCPDSDYYECFKTGRASIVTDTIKTITSDSIELTSGEKLPADIIVTATGLNLRFCGNINVTVDKQPLNIPSQFLWRYSMLTTVPNLFLIVGYVNASWTLGSDTTCRLFTRLINFMNANKYTSAIPTISEAERKNPQCAMRLSSTYVKSALGILPSVGTSGPWLGRDNYFRDSWNAERADLRKGLRFERKST